ncbi:hypothetical protein RhiirA4_472924 [Rhizophagus irregularis]|uniref:Uncharacterized protein n=1 Tax=Rhizophagus irregularis TaxID=588596 RepID=A0A2I1H5T0_9GLOM|nr:hypothetical protein RhiirA4_472924 [Rhizophagus irregularis]
MKCERNEANLEEILYEAINEYEEILISKVKIDEVELFRDINISFIEIITRIWISRCDEVAEIENEKGIDNKDKRKRKRRKEDNDDRDDAKKVRKNEKINKNSLNENREKLIKLVTRDNLLGDVTSGRSIKNNWGTRVKLVKLLNYIISFFCVIM